MQEVITSALTKNLPQNLVVYSIRFHSFGQRFQKISAWQVISALDVVGWVAVAGGSISKMASLPLGMAPQFP